MADVLVAHDTVLDRRVAIKLLRDAPDSEVARARFVSEARILAGLSHPGLVTVLDAGISGEQPYLVMELLPGGTAADLIDRGAQPVDRVAELGAQVAAALVPVHAAGVVHRDVKPSNILLDAGGRARLADFGIARLVADNVRATATGTTVGTMAYLAPEQASGGEVGTRRGRLLAGPGPARAAHRGAGLHRNGDRGGAGPPDPRPRRTGRPAGAAARGAVADDGP